jgi:hypothetical protein
MNDMTLVEEGMEEENLNNMSRRGNTNKKTARFDFSDLF